MKHEIKFALPTIETKCSRCGSRCYVHDPPADSKYTCPWCSQDDFILKGGNMGSNNGFSRPKVSYENGEFLHNGIRVRVVLRRDTISFACSDVTVEAVRQLLAEYDRKFSSEPSEYVLQP